jgi:hypothetical protein
MQVYIVCGFLLLLSLVGCGVGGFMFAEELAGQTEGTDMGGKACAAGLYGCENCTTAAASEFPMLDDGGAADADDDDAAATQHQPCQGAGAQGDSVWLSCAWEDEGPCAAAPANQTVALPGSTTGQMCVNQWECPAHYNHASGKGLAPCGQCPQWSRQGILAYIEDNLRFLGLIAFLVVTFLVVGIAGALVLHKSLSGYQCDSI